MPWYAGHARRGSTTWRPHLADAIKEKVGLTRRKRNSLYQLAGVLEKMGNARMPSPA
jgi:hypothetical protein